MYVDMPTIWKLCFLIVPCLALASVHVKDAKPSLSSPYYRLPTSLGYMNPVSTSVISCSSLAKPCSVPTSGASFDHGSPTRISTVYGSPGPALTTPSSQRSSFIASQTLSSVSSEHHTGVRSHSTNPGHVGTTTLKNTRESQSLSPSTSTIFSRSKGTDGSYQMSRERSTVSSSHSTTVTVSRGSKSAPTGTESRYSEPTSIASQSHSRISPHQSLTKISVSSASQPKSSADRTQTSTKAPSQTRTISSKRQTKSLKSTTKASAITHPMTQTKITTNNAPMTNTGVGAVQSTDAKTSRISQPSKTKKGSRESSTSRSSHPIDKDSPAMKTNSATIVAPTSTRSKGMSETTHHSNRRPATSINKEPETNGLSSESMSESTGIRTSRISTKKTGLVSTRKTTSSDSTRDHTTAASTEKETTSASTKQEASTLTSKHRTSIVTTRNPIKLTSTGSQASSASTKQQTSMVTATEGQPARLPLPTTATKTAATNKPIETIITGSKGTVVTYVATRDPKYTTNRGTTTTTDDRGNDVVVFPGGWIWIPIGLPPFNFPPLKFPPPPTMNPDPESRDPGDDHGHDDENHDHDNKSKSTTKSAECTTTKPPRCTKTVSFISSGTGFTR